MDFNRFYDSVCVFNDLAENKNTLEGFKAQMKCLIEEVKETEKAIQDNNISDVLDGAVDVIYVAMGLMQKLEELGVDIKGAMQQVAEDNLKKFPSRLSDVTETVRKYNKENVNVHFTLNEKYKLFVVKDSNGKLRKPYNFKSTDLTKYVPKELQEKGLV